MRVSGKNKYCFSKQLAEQLFRMKRKKKTGNSCDEDNSDLLDESDESHYEVSPDQIVTVFNRESSEDVSEDVLRVDADNDEFDALSAVMNGTFRDISKTHPVHSNIENTAFATIARSDGHIQVVSKQTICWFLEGIVWKNSRDRKWRFKGCPSGFFEKQKKITTVEKMTLKKGHWAVFITIDGKDYLLGQVLALVTVDGKINNYISEWRGDEKIEIRALCQWYDMERENGKFTGKLKRTFMFSNGYYSCKYYICTCPVPKVMQFDDGHCLMLDQTAVSQLSRFCKFQ